MPKWIIQIAGAKMPASCRSPYVIIRVLEVDDGVDYVSTCRAKAVRRVVYESCPVPRSGTTPRSGRVKELAYAEDMIARRHEIEGAQQAKLAAKRATIQAAVAAKLEAGQPLTDTEYALLQAA